MTRTKHNRKHLRINDNNIEEIESCSYLGVHVDRRSSRQQEIRKRIQTGNKAFYANKVLLKDNNLKKDTKMKIYKTVIRPVVMYAAETLCMSKSEAEQMKVFERKVLRTILGFKRTENGEQRAWMNHEIMEELNGEDIVRFAKSQRIRWLGHIMRSADNSVVKNATLWKPAEDRARGRPRVRWWDQVTGDLSTMGVTDWTTRVQDRQGWRRVVAEAAAHTKL